MTTHLQLVVVVVVVIIIIIIIIIIITISGSKNVGLSDFVAPAKSCLLSRATFQCLCSIVYEALFFLTCLTFVMSGLFGHPINRTI